MVVSLKVGGRSTSSNNLKFRTPFLLLVCGVLFFSLSRDSLINSLEKVLATTLKSSQLDEFTVMIFITSSSCM